MPSWVGISLISKVAKKTHSGKTDDKDNNEDREQEHDDDDDYGTTTMVAMLAVGVSTCAAYRVCCRGHDPQASVGDLRQPLVEEPLPQPKSRPKRKPRAPQPETLVAQDDPPINVARRKPTAKKDESDDFVQGGRMKTNQRTQFGVFRATVAQMSCNKCGAKQCCLSCKARLPPDSVFCNKCGTKV